MLGLDRKTLTELHKQYSIDTDQEKKYKEDAPGWHRYLDIEKLIPSQSIVLEVGCNTGGLLRKVCETRHIVPYGIDLNKKLVQLAQQKGIIATTGDASELPYPSEFFDVCIISEVLEHVYDDIEVYNECCRVLKKGGILIATVPHPRGYTVNRMPLSKHLYHVRNYTKVGFRGLLRRSLKNVKTHNLYSIFASQYANHLLHDRPRWMLGWGFKR